MYLIFKLLNMKYVISILVLFFNFSIYAQKTISGRVTKAGRGILAGAKVSAKDAPMIFTLTDEHGNYKIEIPEEVKSLVFSYSGMATKTVKIKDFIAVNVKLVPAKYKTFRYGTGISFGASNFAVFNKITQEKADTTNIKLKPIALHADFFYRFHKNFELQAMIEDGFNFTKYYADSIAPTGDTLQVEKITGLNRFSISLLINYHIKLDKTGNHSLFAGFGPQFQHLSFLKTNAIGVRFQTGVNLNNYGKTTKLYLAIDVANGKFNEENAYVPGLPFKYISSRLGFTFIF